jgi:tetrahydromethanopterin S-methyltransferase subunit A
MTTLPAVPTLDFDKIREQIERHVEKDAKVLDRSTQLAVAPGARERSRKSGEKAWGHTPMPSDPPIIQMLLYLSEQLESGDWRKIEDDFKRAQMHSQLTKQITDLIAKLEDKASGAFDELCTLVSQQMRATEHADKMAVATKSGDESLSDDQIAAKAKRLGVTLNGDAQ